MIGSTCGWIDQDVGSTSAGRGARTSSCIGSRRLGLGDLARSSPTSTRRRGPRATACGCPRRVGGPMSVEVLADRYEVVNEIARGRHGSASSARDRLSTAEVAIKLLWPAARARRAPGALPRGVAVTGQLGHPGIVPVHDSACTETSRSSS